MLANLKDVLIPAKRDKYAVGLFNTVNMEMARGVISAAEESGSPVIIGTAEVLLPSGPLRELSYLLVNMADKAKVPVVVHFDHGYTEEIIELAMDLGFTSIMYDCSKSPYEENVKKVAKMTEKAHKRGVTVEGELGHVGDNEGVASMGDILKNPSDYFTQPETAKDFTERTGVDALAIAVGNAHGAYKFPPKLDFERITAIKEATDACLVLHGGSGLSDSDFKTAVSLGITKVNIFTDINVVAAQAMIDGIDDVRKGISNAIPTVVERVRDEALRKMVLFGSVNRY